MDLKEFILKLLLIFPIENLCQLRTNVSVTL